MGDTPTNGAAVDAARSGRPPRDDLVRAASPAAANWDTPVGVSIRAEGDGTDGRTLFGHFTVFDEWTEINSMWEGNFLERIAARSTTKTFREQTPKILFQHGMDPQLGDRVIAADPEVLREDETGPYFEARLFDGLDPLIYEGLRAGAYGISFRFSVMREEWVDEPGASDHNPKGLPERTIKEMRISEFGPVTFPAYPGADVGVRSMTDELIIGRATSDPARLRSYLEYLETRDARPQTSPAVEPDEAAVTEEVDAPSEVRAEAEPHPDDERRDDEATSTVDAPLWRADNQAAPGNGPTPLFKSKNTRKGQSWRI